MPASDTPAGPATGTLCSVCQTNQHYWRTYSQVTLPIERGAKFVRLRRLRCTCSTCATECNARTVFLDLDPTQEVAMEAAPVTHPAEPVARPRVPGAWSFPPPVDDPRAGEPADELLERVLAGLRRKSWGQK